MSAKSGELVVIEEVIQDKLGLLAFSVVAEVNGKKYEAEYHLLDLDSKGYSIAGNSVYEVK